VGLSVFFSRIALLSVAMIQGFNDMLFLRFRVFRWAALPTDWSIL
jgi:hypothetical protein